MYCVAAPRSSKVGARTAVCKTSCSQRRITLYCPHSGFGERLLTEVKKLAPKDVKIKVSSDWDTPTVTSDLLLLLTEVLAAQRHPEPVSHENAQEEEESRDEYI